MSQSKLALQKVLAEHGFHNTRVRQAVFDLLETPEPQSMRDIIKKAEGSVDRASIYRNVDLFEKLGILRRIYIGWKYKLELSDDFVQHHHHLSCLNCGKVIDIHEDELVDTFIKNISKQFGFRPQRHQFEVEGLCAECQVLLQSEA